MTFKSKFNAKQTANIEKGLRSMKGDGDIWVERIADKKKLKKAKQAKKGRNGMKRLYYTSVETGREVWDEPPSGASRIVAHTELHEHDWLVQLLEEK